jgi:hypothetical protein
MGPRICVSLPYRVYSVLQNVEFFFLGWLTFDDGTDRLSRNVSNYESILRNIPEERNLNPCMQSELCNDTKTLECCFAFSRGNAALFQWEVFVLEIERSVSISGTGRYFYPSPCHPCRLQDPSNPNISPAACWQRHSVMCSAGTSQKRKTPFNPFLDKAGTHNEEILKTYVPFIFGGIQYTSHLLCESVKKIATT